MMLGLRNRVIPVEPQHFAENENQDHADKDPGLQHVRPDALVTDNADAVSGGEGCETNRQPACKMHESTVLDVSMLFRLSPSMCGKPT